MSTLQTASYKALCKSLYLVRTLTYPPVNRCNYMAVAQVDWLTGVFVVLHSFDLLHVTISTSNWRKTLMTEQKLRGNKSTQLPTHEYPWLHRWLPKLMDILTKVEVFGYFCSTRFWLVTHNCFRPSASITAVVTIFFNTLVKTSSPSANLSLVYDRWQRRVTSWRPFLKHIFFSST